MDPGFIVIIDVRVLILLLPLYDNDDSIDIIIFFALVGRDGGTRGNLRQSQERMGGGGEALAPALPARVTKAEMAIT